VPHIWSSHAGGRVPRLARKGLGTATTALALLALAASPARARDAVPAHPLAVDHLIARLPAASVRAELDGARIGPGAPALGGKYARYGVLAYRVAYQATDAAGRPVAASGLVAFPQSHPGPLRVVEYEHGTTADKADVPSSFGMDAAGDGVEGRWAAELFASAGFAVAEPDYVGLGRGPGRPEYMVAASEVSASLGLLHAAAQLAGISGHQLHRGVLVTGFSQGGSAAMAVGRALEDRAGSPVRLGALAPVSGPYDLTGAEVPGILDGQVDPAMAAYLASYTLTAWNPIYHLYGKAADAFRGAYARTVPRLFDGSHSDSGIAAALPSSLADLLTPWFLYRLRHPSGALLRALKANSTCGGWVPRAPVRLYAAAGDRTVPETNARHCASVLGRGGSQVPLVELGEVGHDLSDFVALPQILVWFRHWLTS
jgi:hypothetical protein